MKSICLGLASILFSFSAFAGQIRNIKPVVTGKVTRAGTTAQAQYNDDTLRQLCEDGYTLGVFLYAGAKDRTVSCSKGSIHYLSMTNWMAIKPVLDQISAQIDSGGKAIFHCWNGVHATGYIAAAALNRFCGFSGAQAAKYFRDGVPAGSLPASSIAKLSAKLEALPSGGHVMEGCPTPR